MKTELFSISKIFTERLLRIPDYQRGYAWSDKQLKEFWSDLDQLEDGHNHYVGVLTLEDLQELDNKEWADDLWVIDSKCYEPLYVVDGQQRLTTIIILIQSILEATDGQDLNYTTPNEIKKKYIYESKDGGISRSYLFGYVVDNPSYEFLKQEIFCEPSDEHKGIEQTIYTNNLAHAKTFFIDRLKDMDFEDVEKLYKKITQHLLFNVYSMSEEIDVHVSFETMNNRGKPLSHLELLKNRLIYLSTKFDTDVYEKNKLRRSINDCWKTIYHQLGRNKDNPLDDDVFLTNHFILFFGGKLIENNVHGIRHNAFRNSNAHKEYLLDEKFTVKSIYTEDKETKLTVKDLYKYVNSMKLSVEKWYEVCNPHHSNLSEPLKFWLQKIIRIQGQQSFPLIMVLLQHSNNDELTLSFLKAIERVLFTEVFASRSYYLGLRPTVFIEWAQELSNNPKQIKSVLEKINEMSDKFYKEKGALKSISDALKEGGFYRWRGLRYFLYEYELDLLSSSKAYTEKLEWDILSPPSREFRDHRDHNTVEHIYPQNPRKKE